MAYEQEEGLPTAPIAASVARHIDEVPRTFRHECKANSVPQQIDQNSVQQAWTNELRQAEMMYGRAAAIELEMDRSLLRQFQRLPGLPSSHIGLDTVMGREYEIDWEDYLGGPSSKLSAFDENVHQTMRRHLGM